MLDIMRKHTKSWIIKLAFVVIILVFIFFFGYTQLSNKGNASASAAEVNGVMIPYGRYTLALEQTQNFYEQAFKDKIPEQMQEQMKSSALMNIVNQELFVQLGKKLGLSVTPDELYDNISKTPSFQVEGSFDPLMYKERILPYFETKYGINFENMLSDDLMSRKVVDFLTGQVTVSEGEAKQDYVQRNTTWSFDRIKVPDEATANNVIETVGSGSKWKIDGMMKELNLAKEKVEDISIDRRHTVIPQAPEHEALKELLLLTMDKPTYMKPIKAGDAYYVFQLVEVVRPSEEQWAKEKDEYMKAATEQKKQAYVMEWQESLRKKADIKEFVLATAK